MHNIPQLKTDLINDLKELGVRSDFNLELKKYSKSLFGRYLPESKRILLYVYKDKECTEMYTYEELI